MGIDDAEGVLAIWNDIREGRESEFEFWYNNEHFPERLAVPGFRVGRRYEAISEGPRSLVYYITDTPEVLRSAAYVERLNNAAYSSHHVYGFHQHESHDMPAYKVFRHLVGRFLCHGALAKSDRLRSYLARARILEPVGWNCSMRAVVGS